MSQRAGLGRDQVAPVGDRLLNVDEDGRSREVLGVLEPQVFASGLAGFAKREVLIVGLVEVADARRELMDRTVQTLLKIDAVSRDDEFSRP